MPNNWKKYGVDVVGSKVFSEKVVSTLIEMLIEDADELASNHEGAGYGLDKQLRAKWLPNYQAATCPKCGDPVMGKTDGLCGGCV